MFVMHLIAILRDLWSDGRREGEEMSLSVLLPSLHELMSDPSVFKGGQDPLRETQRLERTLGWPAGISRGVLCTVYLSTFFRPTASGLSALTALFIGRSLSKPKAATKSDWRRCPLQERQMEYAALDAIASREVMVAMLEAVRERDGLASLAEVVGATYCLVDSSIPKELAESTSRYIRRQCSSCGDAVAKILRKHGMVWALYMLFERCLRDATAGSRNADGACTALPISSSFQPRQMAMDRPGRRDAARVYLPHWHRDVLYVLPPTSGDTNIKGKELYYLAAEKALHWTGSSDENCDLRVNELLSAGGPDVLNKALEEYTMVVRREGDRHIGTCEKKGDETRASIDVELENTKKEYAGTFLKLLLIRSLELNSGHHH